jgi:hypothetical protein
MSRKVRNLLDTDMKLTVSHFYMTSILFHSYFKFTQCFRLYYLGCKFAVAGSLIKNYVINWPGFGWIGFLGKVRSE